MHFKNAFNCSEATVKCKQKDSQKDPVAKLFGCLFVFRISVEIAFLFRDRRRHITIPFECRDPCVPKRSVVSSYKAFL